MSKVKTPKASFLSNVLKGIRVPFSGKPRQGAKPPKQRRARHT